MLGKVMKYETRSMGRLMWPFFGLAIVISALLRLAGEFLMMVWEPAQRFVEPLMNTGGLLLMVAVVLLATVYAIVRFYQSTMANESYLTFTLPVKAGTHVTARFIVHSLFSILSVVVGSACVLILVPGCFQFFSGQGEFPVSISNFGESVTVMMTLKDVPSNVLWSFGGMFAVITVVSTVTGLLMVYASLALGSRLTRNRIVGGFVAYLVLNTVESILTLPAVLPFMFNFGRTNEEFIHFLASMKIDPSQPFAFVSALLNFMWVIMLVAFAINIVFGVVHFFITRYIFTKKLDVE